LIGQGSAIPSSSKQVHINIDNNASSAGSNQPQKSKSLVAINQQENVDSIKRFTDVQKQSMVITSGEQIIGNDASVAPAASS